MFDDPDALDPELRPHNRQNREELSRDNPYWNQGKFPIAEISDHIVAVRRAAERMNELELSNEPEQAFLAQMLREWESALEDCKDANKMGV